MIVLVAFVDGILVAKHYAEEPEVAESKESMELSEIFKGFFVGREDTVEEESAAEPKEIDEEPIIENTIVLQEVPFTTQAPIRWENPYFYYAEEAAVYMAMKWVRGEEMPGFGEVAEDLYAIGRWENGQLGTSKNTSISQTAEIFTGHYGYYGIHVTYNLDELSLKGELANGNVIIIPVNGQVLDNPYYGDPAPEYHMIILLGYDESGRTFIANDPGTSRGEQIEFYYENVLDAISAVNGEQMGIVVIR